MPIGSSRRPTRLQLGTVCPDHIVVTSSRLVASSARVVMVVRAKPARREDTAVDDEEWVVVKDRSIERGWGVSLFAKENGHSASEGAKRIDRALVKYGYAKTLGEAKAMVAAGRVALDGAPAMRADERAEMSQLTVDGEAFDSERAARRSAEEGSF